MENVVTMMGRKNRGNHLYGQSRRKYRGIGTAKGRRVYDVRREVLNDGNERLVIFVNPLDYMSAVRRHKLI